MIPGSLRNEEPSSANHRIRLSDLVADQHSMGGRRLKKKRAEEKCKVKNQMTLGQKDRKNGRRRKFCPGRSTSRAINQSMILSDPGSPNAEERTWSFSAHRLVRMTGDF